MMIRALIVLILGILILVEAAANDDPHRSTRQALRAEMPAWDDLTLAVPVVPSGEGAFAPASGSAVQAYRENLLRVAPWPGGPYHHEMGTLAFKTQAGATERLGVNVFFPRGTPQGTILFVHGYMSHAGNFSYTFSWFVRQGWIVTTVDLPGHGLSDGPRADIDDFASYGNAVDRWMAWVWNQPWPGPHLLLAHSLGSAACFEALRRPSTPRPDKIVFFAPLLRTAWYPAATLGTALLGGILHDVPSRFNWDNYLDDEQMPVRWVTRLSRWLERIALQSPLSLPLTIYTGDRDTVVDADWNAREYRRLVPDVKIVWLRGAGHLFIQDKDSRSAFHERLGRDLGLIP